jgi:hypothetical protein
MDIDPGPRGQKRLLDQDYLSATTCRSGASGKANGNHQQRDMEGESSSMDLNSSISEDEMRIREELTGERLALGLLGYDETEELPIQSAAAIIGLEDHQPSLKKVRFHNDRTRQGSAPPRLEFGFNAIGSSSRPVPSASSLRDQSANGFRKNGILIASDSARDNDMEVQTSEDQDAVAESSADTRMEGLLDDLETEVTCGLCAGVFIDVSF